MVMEQRIAGLADIANEAIEDYRQAHGIDQPTNPSCTYVWHKRYAVIPRPELLVQSSIAMYCTLVHMSEHD
jgi:hypothetical protein